METLELRHECDALRVKVAEAVDGASLEVDFERLLLEAAGHAVYLDQHLCWADFKDSLFNSADVDLHSSWATVWDVKAANVDLVLASEPVVRGSSSLEPGKLVCLEELELASASAAHSLFRSASKDDQLLGTCRSRVVEAHSAGD